MQNQKLKASSVKKLSQTSDWVSFFYFYHRLDTHLITLYAAVEVLNSMAAKFWKELREDFFEGPNDDDDPSIFTGIGRAVQRLWAGDEDGAEEMERRARFNRSVRAVDPGAVNVSIFVATT